MNLRTWWQRRRRGHSRHGKFHPGPAVECRRCEVEREVVRLSEVRRQREQRPEIDERRRHG